jgi:hypothetical protein
MMHLKDQEIESEDYAYIDELIRVQKALMIHRDIFFTLKECSNIWYNRSIAVMAVFLDVPNELEKIVRDIETSEGFESYSKWIK